LFQIPPKNIKSYQFSNPLDPRQTKEKPLRVRYAKAYTNAAKNLVWTSASAKKQQILNYKIFPLDSGFID